jgi:hypothetical protein
VSLFIVLSVWSGPFFTKVNLLDMLDPDAGQAGRRRRDRRLHRAGRHRGRVLFIALGGILLLAVGYDA